MWATRALLYPHVFCFAVERFSCCWHAYRCYYYTGLCRQCERWLYVWHCGFCLLYVSECCHLRHCRYKDRLSFALLWAFAGVFSLSFECGSPRCRWQVTGRFFRSIAVPDLLLCVEDSAHGCSLVREFGSGYSLGWREWFILLQDTGSCELGLAWFLAGMYGYMWCSLWAYVDTDCRGIYAYRVPFDVHLLLMVLSRQWLLVMLVG